MSTRPRRSFWSIFAMIHPAPLRSGMRSSRSTFPWSRALAIAWSFRASALTRLVTPGPFHFQSIKEVSMNNSSATELLAYVNEGQLRRDGRSSEVYQRLRGLVSVHCIEAFNSFTESLEGSPWGPQGIFGSSSRSCRRSIVRFNREDILQG